MKKKYESYDVVIIGGGPAGLTSAIYCARARLNTLLIEKSLLGGLATYTNEICNYPGFPNDLSGLDLMKQFEQQAKKFGVKIKLTDVKKVLLDSGGGHMVETFRTIYQAKVVIIATGGRPRLTGATHEKDYLFDKGISFCATCDAAANSGKTVMVIGSGDAAVEEGMFLTKFADKVIMSVIHDEGIMDANEIAKNQVLQNPKMEFKWNTMVDAFEGEGHLNTVVLKNLKTGELEPVKVDTCFLFIGYIPNSDLFKEVLTLNKQGYIISNEDMETEIPGVFVAGDIRQKSLRQVATAVGDGAIAGVAAERYIAETELFEQQIMQKEKVGLIYIFSAIDAPSRELISEVQKIEEKMGGKVKLNLIDFYKKECLCKRLGTEIEPMTVVYTKDGNVVKKEAYSSQDSIVKTLTELCG
ncbi:pyridine nucleotide-disulfide oxidoreductase [candidate division KSB3 bacterium]|uniref:Pyridine nucleotide-disulfide oxidoreductase n=1 Tax=candidate division KSB3 bacterium TaxID=2044937 RepID=A0A2G6E1Z6_9BACT|nr:MAG: pyridine nucleotide-disulfide oxidoreductase [candidate division KSB3 bacterium]PIE28780.1 MAG: pyridine nucleotide-disulfide oxidoreductase [candidate division KSB3 bacterium]